MKKWGLLLFICLCHLGMALPIQDHIIDPVALTELCLKLNISPQADVISETQKKWLRKPGQERWEVSEILPEQRAFVLKWGNEQGLFSAWKPSSQKYDKALILGATTSRMQMRLDYLKELWLEGVHFDEIVFLTGERPLDPRVDGLIDRCHNESEAAHILWEETDLPEAMRSLPIIFIAVPMKGEGVSLKRPNTEDTLLAWLKTVEEPSSALFVSDQPFCGYQFAVIKSCLPSSFAFDVVGQGVDPYGHPAAAAITLDAIARWIYQDYLYSKGVPL